MLSLTVYPVAGLNKAGKRQAVNRVHTASFSTLAMNHEA
jgi:hypothetical protein